MIWLILIIFAGGKYGILIKYLQLCPFPCDFWERFVTSHYQTNGPADSAVIAECVLKVGTDETSIHWHYIQVVSCYSILQIIIQETPALRTFMTNSYKLFMKKVTAPCQLCVFHMPGMHRSRQMRLIKVSLFSTIAFLKKGWSYNSTKNLQFWEILSGLDLDLFLCYMYIKGDNHYFCEQFLKF